MKGRIDFVRPNDYLVPTGDTRGATTVAHWLGNDIQYSSGNVEEWLTIFDEVSHGKKAGGYQGTGNTHSVMAMAEVVYIECEYVEELKVLLTHEQAKEILNNYKLFLQSDYKSNWVEGQPFDIEYIAEGQEALDGYIATGGSLGQSA